MLDRVDSFLFTLKNSIQLPEKEICLLYILVHNHKLLLHILASAFIYALSLLNVQYEKHPL